MKNGADPQQSSIIIIVNDIKFYCSHRAILSRKVPDLLNKPVIVYAPPEDGFACKDVNWQPLAFQRARRSSFDLLQLISAGLALGWQNPRSIFHLVTIFPIIFCGLPLRLLRRKCVFAISGFGTVLSPQYRFYVLKPVLFAVFRYLFNAKTSSVIVQNQEAKDFLVASVGISPHRIHLVTGADIDENLYAFFPKAISRPPKILVPARLIREKGIFEMAAASQQLTSMNFEHEVWFAGKIDPGNPLSLSQADVDALAQKFPALKFLGHTSSLHEWLQRCDLVCLPSYHEGLPKALIEACATGRPIVAYDVIGVREIVADGHTGLLVPAKSTRELAEAIVKLCTHPDLAATLARNAHQQFLDKFCQSKLVSQTIDVYRQWDLVE